MAAPRRAVLPAPAHVARQRTESLERSLGGAWVAGSGGPAFVIDHRYALQAMHGRRRLETAFSLSPNDVARFARLDTDAEIDLRRAVFLDIETTGLAGGAGTLPFLIGVGRVDADQLLVRQFFLPDPALEPAMLAALSDFLRDACALVTFNGRSFDVPMIETRYVCNRLRSAVELPNVDLLFPSRRIWRGWLPSCRLTALEEHVFDFQRGPDIAGAEIPGRYFRYLSDGRLDVLQPVLRHNVWDVLSMVALVAEIGLIYRGVAGPSPREHLIAGRLWESERDLARAALCYQRALKGGLGDGERYEAMTRLAALYRRLGQWSRAAEIWQALVERPGNLAVRPYLDLARYHERRLRNLEGAVGLLRAAMDLVQRYHLRVAPDRGAALRADIEVRLVRIEQKMASGR
jgi:hypothetical protein